MAKGLRVYADSCMYLSLIKKDADLVDDGRPRWQVAQSLFRAAERGDVIILASTLVQVEVNGNADVRSGATDSTTADQVKAFFLSDFIEWCDVDRLIARRAGEMSTQYHLRGPDAVHLATAARLHAAYLISNDDDFEHARAQAVDSVRVIKPAVVWQETLEDGAPHAP